MGTVRLPSGREFFLPDRRAMAIRCAARLSRWVAPGRLGGTRRLSTAPVMSIAGQSRDGKAIYLDSQVSASAREAGGVPFEPTVPVAGDNPDGPARAGCDASLSVRPVWKPALEDSRVRLGGGECVRGGARAGGEPRRRGQQGDCLHIGRDRVEQHGDQGHRPLLRREVRFAFHAATSRVLALTRQRPLSARLLPQRGDGRPRPAAGSGTSSRRRRSTSASSTRAACCSRRASR